MFCNSRFTKDFTPEDTEPHLLANAIQSEEILEAFRATLKDGQSRTVKDYQVTNQSGSKRFYEIKINPTIGKKSGKIHGAVGVFHNVSESKLLEQMRVDFVANVSHEIRTPLTSIKGFSQVLKSQAEKFDKATLEYIDKILVNSERLHRLFSDLLNLSIIESRSRLKKSRIDLKNMIEGVKSMLLENYKHKKITFTYNLEVDHIQVHPKLFEQALINLLDNACKYAGESPEVEISSFIDGSTVVVSVADSGPGISKEHIDRVFERFYRVDESRHTQNQASGTGLGLSIVKHIIRQHKGKIWVESPGKRGTVFFIQIPSYN